MIGDEEELMCRIRELVENYGTGLITTEHDDVDPLMLEEINNLFNQNIKGIDRLKHVIIYEAVRNVELTNQIAIKKGIEAKLPELKNEANRISRLDPAIQKYVYSILIVTLNYELVTFIKCCN